MNFIRRNVPWIAGVAVLAGIIAVLAWNLNDCRRALVPGGWFF